MEKRSSSTWRQWIRLASSWPVVRRALFYAIVVGAILNAINHGPDLACGRFTATSAFQMTLTLFVPYTVSTLSSVSAMLQAEAQNDS